MHTSGVTIFLVRLMKEEDHTAKDWMMTRTRRAVQRNETEQECRKGFDDASCWDVLRVHSVSKQTSLNKSAKQRSHFEIMYLGLASRCDRDLHTTSTAILAEEKRSRVQ